MDRLSLRKYLLKNDIPLDEITKVMALEHVCTFITKLIPRNTNNVLVDQLKKYENQSKELINENSALLDEINQLKAQLKQKNPPSVDKSIVGEIKELKSQNNVLAKQSQSMETVNRKLVDENKKLKETINKNYRDTKLTTNQIIKSLPVDALEYMENTIDGYRRENNALVKSIVKLRTDSTQKDTKIKALHKQITQLKKH